jgi:peptidoglycan/xylan/chitin deacetylase (PgdA/CDA1 family)
MLAAFRTGPCVRSSLLVFSFIALMLLVAHDISWSMPIPTNIPRNKLSAQDVEYLLQKDKNPVWLNAELQTYQLTKRLADLNAAQLASAPVAPMIVRGNYLRKEVAFTFDDGPHAVFTPDLISILVQYRIPATMFLVGTQAERFPYLVKQEQEAGLTIGDHTYHHFSLTKMPQQYVAAEIKGCGDVIQQITGKTPTLFRPPGGDYSPTIARIAGKLGYTTVMWTVDPGDFNKPAAAVVLARTLGKVSNGSILLFHDGIPQTMEALPLIIDYLRANGYKIVSVDEMLRERRIDDEWYRNGLKLAKNSPVHVEALGWHQINPLPIKE